MEVTSWENHRTKKGGFPSSIQPFSHFKTIYRWIFPYFSGYKPPFTMNFPDFLPDFPWFS